MNRRTFLLGVGAGALSISCTPTPAPTKPRSKPTPPADTGEAPPPEPDEGYVLANVLRSPIALYRDRLVQETRHGELRFWDVRAMTKVRTVELRVNGLCFLSYGALAALVQPDGEKRADVHVIDLDGTIAALRGPEIVTQIDAEMVTGASADEVFISDSDYNLVRLELRPTEVRQSGRIAISPKQWPRLRQLTSLGDGRVVVRGFGRLTIFEPDKPAFDYSTKSNYPIHVTPASGKRVWYSHVTEIVAPREATLVRFEAGALAVDAHVDVSPAEIWHMASGAGALALLVHGEHTWSVMVVDESGTERWRTDVPATFAPNLRSSYVAIGDHRVVLVNVSNDALLAWDSTTGQPIT